MMDFLYRIKERALKSRLITDSFWAIFGNVIGRGLILISGIIIARFLGKDIYGQYGIIKNTLLVIAVFSTFGLGYTATKYIAEYKNSKPELIPILIRYTWRVTIIVSGFMAIALFLSSDFVADKILDAKQLKTPLRIVAVWIVFNALTTAQIGILSGLGSFKEIARVNTIVGIFTFFTSVLLTYYWGLEGALMSLLLSQVLNWLLFYLFINKYNKKKKEKNDKTITNNTILKEILLYTLPISLQEAVYSVSSWTINLLIIRLSSFGELGLYSAAMQWSAIILFIPAILRNVVLTHLAEAGNNIDRHKRIMKITLTVSFVVTFFPFIIIVLFSDFFVSFYGATFAGLNLVLIVVTFTTIFIGLGNVYDQAYMAFNKNWALFGFRLLRNVGIIFLIIILLNVHNGQKGALYTAVSNLIMNIIVLIAMVIFYHKYYTNSLVYQNVKHN